MHLRLISTACQITDTNLMCTGKKSFFGSIFCITVLAVTITVLYFTAPQMGKAESDENNVIRIEESSLGGRELAQGRFLTDRASPFSVNGIMMIRQSSDGSLYIRFEGIELNGEAVSPRLYLTSQPYPIKLDAKIIQQIDLQDTIDGTFSKTGSYNYKLPNYVNPQDFKGALIWSDVEERAYANLSFEDNKY